MKTISSIAATLLYLHNADSFLSVTTPSNNHRPAAPLSLQPPTYPSAGPPAVDMNQYNLPLRQSISEWTAVLQPRTSLQEGIFLRPKSTRDLFVDTLQFRIRRQGGLGLLLTELAGRDDGVGITIVEEVLAGGNAEDSGILPGDSIVALAIRQSSGETMDAEETTVSVSTECLAYDATIEALASLPSPMSSEEEIVLTVKRLRRQPKVNVRLQYPPQLREPDVTIELFAGENLRRAMLTRGIKLNDKLARRFDSGGSGDCGSDGTCATCVVAVTKGMELLSPMKEQESQILSEKPRWRMACKAVVGYGMAEGDLTIQVNPRQWEA